MIAIKARTINTITRGILENGSILIENGKITTPIEQITIAGNFYNLLSYVKEIGNLDVSQAAEIIELDNGYVMPGLIDCHTHLSVHQHLVTNPGSLLDVNEGSDPITPQIHAIDAFNP